MVTMIPEIPEPPTPQDPPAQFNQKAADSWAGLYAAVPKMNQQAEEIAQIGQDAGAAKVRAIAEADAALGYRNEAVAARDSAQADAVSAAQADASAVLAAARAETAAESAETAAASAGDRVPMTGPAGAAILPEGIQADRPDPPPADGLLVRGNTDTGKPEWYNRAKSAWQPFGDAGGELFNYAWHNGPRSSIDVGRVPTDGQQLLLLTHPDVCQAIWDGKQNAVDESVWQADPTKRNCWSRGDGTSWVRVPDLNAAVAGTGKPFYLRGGPESLNGTSVGDAIRNITGTASASGVWGLLADSANVTGPFGIAPYSAQYKDLAGGGFASTAGRALTFDVSKAVPTADENRVKTAYGVMTVRVFTEVSNVGTLDAGQLATQLGVVDAKVQALDAATGFTIIYPNGGSAASPATVAINSRYVSANPFPGSYVMCVPQVLWNGIWGEPGWDGNTGSGAQAIGVRAGMANADVVVQTGITALLGASFIEGSMHGVPSGTLVSTPLPCRVLCWKLKGVM